MPLDLCPWIQGKPFQSAPLVLEDPLDMSNNVGQSCFGFTQVQQAFAEAYDALIGYTPGKVYLNNEKAPEKDNETKEQAQTAFMLSQGVPSPLGCLFGASHHSQVISLIDQAWGASQWAAEAEKEWNEILSKMEDPVPDPKVIGASADPSDMFSIGIPQTQSVPLPIRPVFAQPVWSPLPTLHPHPVMEHPPIPPEVAFTGHVAGMRVTHAQVNSFAQAIPAPIGLPVFPQESYPYPVEFEESVFHEVTFSTNFSIYQKKKKGKGKKERKGEKEEKRSMVYW